MAAQSWGEKLDSLRAKPEPVRRRIALGASVALTLAITLVWATSLRYTLLVPAGSQTAAAGVTLVPAASSQGEGGSPSGWSGMLGRIKHGWQKLTN